MTDLTELFARDPLQLTQEDISTIVAEMRKSRQAFNLGNVKAGNTKPKSAKQKQVSDLLGNLNIDI